MGANEVAVRFRHTCGVDSGPYPFPLAASISSLKEKLLAEWPAEGPLAGERPASVAEIKLICSGKFLENNVVLGSLKHVLGEPGSDVVVTMHVVLRPPLPAKAPAAPKAKEPESKSCCCIS
ncbi:hypothetical protein D9Q98_000021 [Chlorella vulgaris]|uniref:UBL3-like ubiquitin domain-containing protein n=1 Tax=Chlorella vulgaris TaxID=3077 RepID=A0A9D4TXE8_CHLVU|nr:hypothetical protein D9Q98_000021 [Chlorella vulgaris]